MGAVSAPPNRILQLGWSVLPNPHSALRNLRLGGSEPPPVAACAHHSPSRWKSAARHKYNAAVVRCGRHLSPKLSN